MNYYNQGALAPTTPNRMVRGASDFERGASHFYRRGGAIVGGEATNWIVSTILDLLHIILMVGGAFTVFKILIG